MLFALVFKDKNTLKWRKTLKWRICELRVSMWKQWKKGQIKPGG